MLAVSLASVAAACSDKDPYRPPPACAAGLTGLTLTVQPNGATPRIAWTSDGCEAHSLFVQDMSNAGSPTWSIGLADPRWDAPGLPAEITYGVVPPGAVQLEPESGPAIALVSGREYLVTLWTRSTEVGGSYGWQTMYEHP